MIQSGSIGIRAGLPFVFGLRGGEKKTRNQGKKFRALFTD
ncbi:hypothetical protein LEP1GSC061_0246 [Leptospira wolffii serovar Khorat str. Khorat-H2]|nr:hypothetical protein LEP1GSC061_0246 [Leptospira wolffii serovar Khorat str. Khorat-H2]